MTRLISKEESESLRQQYQNYEDMLDYGSVIASYEHWLEYIATQRTGLLIAQSARIKALEASLNEIIQSVESDKPLDLFMHILKIKAQNALKEAE